MINPVEQKILEFPQLFADVGFKGDVTDQPAMDTASRKAVTWNYLTTNSLCNRIGFAFAYIITDDINHVTVLLLVVAYSPPTIGWLWPDSYPWL